MLDVSVEDQRELYDELGACMDYLRGVEPQDYPWPSERTTFHIYTEVKSPKELMVIKSFLATQDLERCQMVIWSDICIKDNPLLQPYLEYVTLKVWDPVAEAQGTLLEGHTEILEARDYLYWVQSDLLRLLVLYKYGGIWVDMDIIFLRDFRPILDQEFMYAWSGCTDFAGQGACATVLGLKRQSELATLLLGMVIDAPFREATTCWGRDLFAAVYRKQAFTVFPCGFFNPDWGDSQGSGKSFFDRPIEEGDTLFEDAFTWHWHNSSNKELNVTSGSKFACFETMMHAKLAAAGVVESEVDMVSLYRRALSELNSGDLGQAQDSCELLTQENSDFAAGWALLGDIAAAQGFVAEALEAYRVALASKYARSSYVINAQHLMRKARSPEEVLEFLLVQQKRHCEHPEILANIGALKEELGELEGAAIAYERAVHLRPTAFYPNFKLAHVYRKLGRVERAASLLSVLVDEHPEYRSDRAVRLTLSLLYRDLGEYTKALEIAREPSC